jgi:hypothetical protein
VPSLTAFTAFQAVINLFREQTQWLHLWRLRDHIIVCGLGRKGGYLVDQLLVKGLRVVAIEKNLEPATADEYRRKGVIVIEGDAADPDTLESARLSHASHLICLLGNDQQNLAIALQAHQLVKRSHKKTLTCILHLVSEDLLNLVKKSELNIDKEDHFVLEIFNTYKRTAQILVSQNSLTHSTPSNLLVVGLGRLGQNIILETVFQRYTQRSAENIKITVIDRDAIAKVGRLLQDYPQMASVCDLEPIQIDLSSNTALQHALPNTGGAPLFDRTFICLGNPILAIQVSLALLEIVNLSNGPFFIRLEKNSGLFNLLENPISGHIEKERIIPFDMYEQTCSYDLVFGGLHELLAIKLRENYVNSLKSPQAEALQKIPWEAISETEKDANRAQANRICHLLNAHGYAVNPLRDWDAGKFLFNAEEVSQMAKMEHTLWCEWKRQDGWQFGAIRDNENKIHPDLVSWEDLPIDERNKNKDFVSKLPELLAELGFQIDKVL